MFEPFGPRFYEWWAGLARPTRYAVAGTMLAGGAVLGYVHPEGAWFLWWPPALVGGVLILLA
jgi:hypothetical protein